MGDDFDSIAMGEIYHDASACSAPAATGSHAWKTAKNWDITPVRGRHGVAVIGEETACGSA
jgi:hypothetical protein